MHLPSLTPSLTSRLARRPLMVALVVLAALLVTSVRAQAAGTGTMDLTVQSASDATPVTTFKYIVNVDNTGTTAIESPIGTSCDANNPFYVDLGSPDHCPWTSIAGVPGSSPVATQGDQSDFAGTDTLTLPAGRYLVSVLADGYKLDGEHFTVPDGGNVAVTVKMQPTPIPDGVVRALVFEDNAPTNSAPDVPAEDGLAGFEGQLTDYIGQIITDVYGNPLCTKYVGENPNTFEIDPAELVDGVPQVATVGGHCFSDANGMLAIPHMGTNRYALSVIPPNGTNWVQTTTLEGNHDWDWWLTEGATGYDTEFVNAGEPVPPAVFGFVRPQNTLPAAASGSITGVVDAMKIYIPAIGGLPGTAGDVFGGLNGAKIDKPINRPWIALSDLQNGDQAVYVGRGGADGTFNIQHVPDGNYSITWWDDAQNYILDLQQVTVSGGQVEDLGILPLQEWWTQFEGHVFNDLNSNGKLDPGEPGVKDMAVTIKKRENSVMDRGGVTVTTKADGSYYMENVYPMTQWLVMEVYSDVYKTTGVTYQADNQTDETTVLGAGVDVSILPIIGLGGRIDWGVKPYASGDNGGIVGTVSYDTTRNELDPRFAAVEDWQPGIPDLPVSLYAPVPCPSPQPQGVACDTTPAGDSYVLAADGSYAHGQLLNQYITENWERPGTNDDGVCVPRDVDGNRLTFSNPASQLVTKNDTDCLEGPLMGVQFQQGFSTVDGNYGLGDGCLGLDDPFVPATGKCTNGGDPTGPLPPDDYIVSVGNKLDTRGRPTYKVTREEDINIGNGDQTVPQIPPPACVGAMHTVDVAGIAPDGPDATVNPTFVDIGGSPYEGEQKPLCDQKLVHVSNQRSIAPTFNMYTDVPVPGRFWGLLVDDLNFSTDKRSLLYGEKAGVPFAPVGIYDYTNRLVATVESDYNGLFDVLLPSTNRINCPTPSGVCASVYRFVGNDPGVPGRLNANHRPEFRTIAAEFEAFPGLIVPADLAPTQVGVSVQLPGGQTNYVTCKLADDTPQLMAVSRPYVRLSESDANRTFVINGQGFGANGSVTLDGTFVLPTTPWNDRQITVSVPASTPPGAHQLNITSANGQSTVNGLTFHVLGGTYNPNLYEVGPGKTYAPANTLPATADHAIQRAIDAAEASAGNDLIVVYPGLPTTDNPRVNPRGAYYENLVITKPFKLQGVGPGGVQTATNTTVPGSIIDGGAFGGDSPVATDWQAKVAGISWAGNQNVNDGAVITIYAQTNAFPLAPTFEPTIDGLDIRGGDQQGFPTNINQANGGTPTGLPAAIVTQGGAIFANAYARALHISNNVVQNNGGGYGTIRIGTPDLPAPNNHNENLVIARNRVISNGGTNLAGGIAIFAGADDYDVAGNDICGNFSAEYGGGISHFGYSPGGKIRNNRVYFNKSYDEGGGIFIGGTLPTNPNTLSPGSGPVDVDGNLIQYNLANDDGGGLRFLMAGNFTMNVRNNMIVNNVSTHEGGGVALDDAPDVRFVNNTVMKNVTTATAITSNGLPAPAGLATTGNSAQLQVTLPGGSPTFSRPFMFNNIFWDNRAGSRSGATVAGIGLEGDLTPIYHWDMGSTDPSARPLTPTNSVLQESPAGNVTSSPSNVLSDPNVISAPNTAVDIAPWRTNPNFVGAILVVNDVPANLLSDYHLRNNTSPAYNAGAASKTVGALTVPAPPVDYDADARPAFVAFDIGADEIGMPRADLAITKTDGLTQVYAGRTVTYTITVTNLGPAGVGGATVADTLPARLAGASWTCSATAGSSCAAGSGSGNISTTVDLLRSGSATFTVTGTVSAGAVNVPLANTATVAPPSGTSDPVTTNNSATDTDTIVAAADLRVTKTDNQTAPAFGSAVSYSVVISNLGPNAVTGAIVNDPAPLGLTGVRWTCAPTPAAAGTSCNGTSGTGSIPTNKSVNIAAGGALTFTINATVSITGTIANTATVSPPAGTLDPDTTNNSATDTDTVPLPSLTFPSLPVLDAFTRANANTLAPGWSQLVVAGQAGIRVNNNEAYALADGQALWTATVFGADQSARLTLAGATPTGGLILKAGGGPLLAQGVPQNYLLVSYQGGGVTVSTTTNFAVSFTLRASFPATMAAGDTLSAVALADGTVRVWKNSQLVGVVRIPTSGSGAWTQGTGGGRIGIRLPAGARIDDFGGKSTTIAGLSLPLGARVLQLGMSGPDVTQLQRILRNQGLAVTVNGTYGPKTRQAVTTLQRRFGLRANGVANAAFLARLGIRPLGSRVLRSGMHGSDVRDLQRLLRAHSLAVTVNGTFDAKTRTAVTTLQRRFGLRATGVANAAFLRHLGY